MPRPAKRCVWHPTAARRRQGGYEAVTRRLQGSYKAVIERLQSGYKAVTKRLYSGYHGAAGGAEAVGLEEQGRIHLAVTRRRLRLSVDGYGYASTVTPRR